MSARFPVARAVLAAAALLGLLALLQLTDHLMKKLKFAGSAALTVVLACSLVACAGDRAAQPQLDQVATGIRTGELVYCNGITEEARQALRDQLTGGVRVIDCSMVNAAARQASEAQAAAATEPTAP